MNAPQPNPALCLVPVSPAMAALIHQLQQEASDANAAPEPGSIVLDPAGPLRPASVCSTRYHVAYSEDYCSASIYLQPSVYLPGGLWTGEETRRDAQGRCWTRRIHGVINDFGDLVEVPA